MKLAAVILVAVAARPALADRPIHGSLGGGSALLWTAADDKRLRYELAFDIEPYSRYGAHVAWRGFNGDYRGMVLGGIVFEPAAARPRLVVDMHGDVGADLDQRAPVIGGGIRTTLTIYKLVGIALDGGAYLVIDGVDDIRLRLMGSTSLVLRW